MLNGEFSFRYHLTLIASTRHKLQMLLLMFIADCMNKVFFFAYTSSSATHKHTLHDNSSLCIIFLLSLPFMDLRRQSFTADAMSFAYHISDLINYFKQLPSLFDSSFFYFCCCSSFSFIFDVTWRKTASLLF